MSSDAGDAVSLTSSKNADMANWKSKQCDLCKSFSTELSPYKNASESDEWNGRRPWHDWTTVFVVILARSVKKACGNYCGPCFSVWRSLGEDLRHATLSKYKGWVMQEPETRHQPFLHALKKHIENKNRAISLGQVRLHDRDDMQEAITVVMSEKKSGKRCIERIFFMKLDDVKIEFGEPESIPATVVEEELTDGVVHEGIHLEKSVALQCKRKTYELEVYTDVGVKQQTETDDGQNVVKDGQQQDKFGIMQKVLQNSIKVADVNRLLDAMRGKLEPEPKEKSNSNGAEDSDDDTSSDNGNAADDVDYRKKALSFLMVGKAAKGASNGTSGASTKPGSSATSKRALSNTPTAPTQTSVNKKSLFRRTVSQDGQSDEAPLKRRGPGRPAISDRPKDIVHLSSKNIAERSCIAADVEQAKVLVDEVKTALTSKWCEDHIEADKHVQSFFKSLTAQCEKHGNTLVKMKSRTNKFIETGCSLPHDCETAFDEATDFLDTVLAVAKQMSLANPKVTFARQAYEKLRKCKHPVPLAVMCKDFDLRANDMVAMTDYKRLISLCSFGSDMHGDFTACPHYKESFLCSKIVRFLEALIMKLARHIVVKDLAGPLDKAIKLTELLVCTVEEKKLIGWDELSVACSIFTILMKANTASIKELQCSVKSVESNRNTEGESVVPLLKFLATVGGGSVIWNWAKEVAQKRSGECQDEEEVETVKTIIGGLGDDWTGTDFENVVYGRTFSQTLSKRYKSSPGSALQVASVEIADGVAKVVMRHLVFKANALLKDVLSAVELLLFTLRKPGIMHTAAIAQAEIAKMCSLNDRYGDVMQNVVSPAQAAAINQFEEYVVGDFAAYCKCIAVLNIASRVDDTLKNICNANLIRASRSNVFETVASSLEIHESHLENAEKIVFRPFRNLVLQVRLQAEADMVPIETSLMSFAVDRDMPESLGDVLSERYYAIESLYEACCEDGTTSEQDFSHIPAFAKAWPCFIKMFEGKEPMSKNDFLTVSDVLTKLQGRFGAEDERLQVDFLASRVLAPRDF